MRSIIIFVLIGSITCGFRDHASKIYIGVGLTSWSLSQDENYRAIAAKQFNCLTPGNEMKFDATEPIQGQFFFAPGQKFVTFAQENNMTVRGHTLVWHSQAPAWLEQLNGTALEDAMINHIRTLVDHWKGSIYAWDVVNEALNEDGSLRNSFWLQELGESYIATAFKTARAADPNAKLYINDYNVESINAKSTGLYNLVKKLKSEGVPIDGVGIQSHLNVTTYPKDYEENLQRFSDLGVDVAVTELDVGLDGQSVKAQAEVYGDVIKSCVNVTRCVGVTIWGITDNDSWRGQETPLPWNEDEQPKPEIISAIENALK